MAGLSAMPVEDLIKACLARGHSVQIGVCGQYKKRGEDFYCRVARNGYGLVSYIDYGTEPIELIGRACNHVLVEGFTQEPLRL